MADKKKGIGSEFKEFIMRGNVIDMAVGVVIGSAFTAIVTAIVEDIITPIISLIMGSDAPFGAFFVGPFGIGDVLDKVLSFIITAIVLFAIVKATNKLSRKKETPPEEPAPPAPSKEELLLTEIRDLLKDKN